MGTETSRPGAIWSARRIAAVLIAALFVVFVVQNRGQTTVQLLLFNVTAPLYAVLLVTFVVGAAVAWLWSGRVRRRRG